MSLRARLLVGLLVLSAAGIAVVGVVSYTALRSYLSERVDQQVEFAGPPLVRALAERSGSEPELLRQLRRLRRVADQPRPEETQLPPGTYGELRNATGEVITRVTFSYGERDLSKPVLDEEDLEVTGEPVSVDASDGGPGFRVLVTTAPSGERTAVVAVPLTELQETLDRLALIEAIVAAAVLIALGLLSWWLIRIGLRPLERIADTAGAIASGDLTRRVEPANPRTEVGRLGLALNEALAQIERAFAQRTASEERLRRFLADASHELRTPLSSIRGYSELFRIGAVADAGDLERAMERIESESVRMGEIVDNLFTLARLDQVAERVREPIDLADLAGEACADARAAAPKRRIELTTDPPAVVEGDADQFRQVLSNLLANAVVHTPEGTPIEVAVLPDAKRVEIEVRDHGPGLEPGTQQRVFERFWRPSRARVRSQGGAGLGLAIVKAIVHDHGGVVSAENVPGGGASFRVSVPLLVRDPAVPARVEAL